MGFVYERIADEDAERFQVPALAKLSGCGEPLKWAVDHEREIFLYWIRAGREPEDSHIITFGFVWGGSYYAVNVARELDCADIAYSLRILHVPVYLKSLEPKMLRDLKSALRAWFEGSKYHKPNSPLRFAI